MGAPSVIDSPPASRFWSLSGAAFVVLAVVAIIGLGGNSPDANASAAKVSSFYLAHQNRENLAAFILAASVPLLVIFGITLAFALWPAGRRPLWPSVLIAGTVLTAGAFSLSAFIHFALADSADNVTAATSQGLNALDSDTWIAFNGCMAVMMLGAAGSIITRAAGLRVLGWIALLLGLVLFIPFADFFALLLSAIWIIVVSALLFRRGAAFVGAGADA
jgi:hypothetical protein